MATLVDDLVPDQLWALVEPLLPAPTRPPYGGRHRTVSDRNCFAAIVYMARTSTPWRLLPAQELDCGSPATVWRRCRSVRVPMPQSRVSTVPAACGLRVSAGRVRCPSGGPSVSAGCADLARNPGCLRNRTPRQCPPDVRECGRVLVGRLLFAAAAAPLSRAGTWRSPAADRRRQ
jgi:transposase